MKTLPHAQPATKRAAIYPRVSSRNQEEEGTSLGTQEAACLQFATERAYTVAPEHVYREVFTGVELWARPQLTKLREAIRRREVDVVIAYAIDRLSRDPVHLGVLLTEADHAGVEVRFVTEPLDNTPEGQLIRFVRGYAAKVEHEKIKERTLRGRLARAQSGKLIPAVQPQFGYLWGPGKANYVEDPLKAAAVRRIFREALEGKATRAIAVDLARDGVPAPRGTTWRNTTVFRILTTRGYTGEGYAWRWQATRVSGKFHIQERPRHEWIPLPAGTFPPLVSVEDFEAVQQRLRLNKRFAVRNNSDPTATLLRAGYVRCAHCGGSMAAVKGKHAWEYACTKAASTPGGCKQHRITAHILDRAVWERIEYVLTTPDVIAREVARLQQVDPTSGDVDAIEQALADVARRQANLVKRLATVDDEEVAGLVQRELSELAKQRAALSAEREQVLRRRQGWVAAQSRLAELTSWCGTVASRVAGMTYEQKRLALEALGVQSSVYRRGENPDRWVITATLPIPAPVQPGNCHSNDTK